MIYGAILYSLTDLAGVLYLISSIIGSVIGNAANFIIQKFWAFRDKDLKKTHWQGLLFLIKVIILLIINTALLWLLVDRFSLHYLLAQLLIVPLTTTLSFVISKKIFTNKNLNKIPDS